MGFLSALMGGGESRPAPAPAMPADDSRAREARERAAEEERLRRVSAGKQNANPTGGLGDTSNPSLAAKALLGS